MELLGEIRECFASQERGFIRFLESLPKEYPAVVIRFDEEYGVAMTCRDDLSFLERFANARLYTKNLNVKGQVNNYLILSSTMATVRYEFATVCAEFVDPGEKASLRKSIIADPLQWWEKWKNMLGNTISDKSPYSVLAELIVLHKVYKENPKVEWAAINSGSHDIEGEECSFEVKSTIQRYGATITVSGQHQLQTLKRLQLYFCRLEKSLEGKSINDVCEELKQDGYDENKIEEQLKKIGYEKGSSKRNEKYKVLEKRIYEVNDRFPRIIDSSFKDDKYPSSIIQISYTVDLDGLEYSVW